MMCVCEIIYIYIYIYNFNDDYDLSRDQHFIALLLRALNILSVPSSEVFYKFSIAWGRGS